MYSKRDLYNYARKCAKINSALYDLIINCEEFLNDDISKDILHNSYNGQNEELIINIKKTFLKIANDSTAISPELHIATLSTAYNIIDMIDED